MSNGNNPPIGSKYILEGRLVTMGPQGVIPDGALYIEDGEIKHVLPTSAPAPAEFKGVKRIRTGDTLYPGLIELHNHLSYNAIPLWDVPQRYSNNGQWRNHSDYPRLITKPYGRLFLNSLPNCQMTTPPRSQLAQEMRRFYRQTHHLVEKHTDRV